MPLLTPRTTAACRRETSKLTERLRHWWCRQFLVNCVAIKSLSYAHVSNNQPAVVHHPLFAAIYDSLALTYEGGSKNEEAEKCFKVAITNYEQTIGADSLDCTAEVQRLGYLYNKVSQFKKAEALLERAVKVCRKHVPPEHFLCLISLLEQARAYIGLGDFTKANAVLDELLPIAERVAPTGSERMVDTLELRAISLCAEGRADEAVLVQRRADAMRTRYPSARKPTATVRAK